MKQRNVENGLNSWFIGNMAVIAIYQYWEDNFRGTIAESLGRTKDELQSSIFGDIRHLRRSIIHNGGYALQELENSEVLRWFQKGEHIYIDNEKFRQLVEEVNVSLSTYSRLACFGSKV